MNVPCLHIISDNDTSHEVDLAEVADIALTFCINDIFKLSQPSNGFTKGVKLLGTAKTNKVLQFIYRIDKIDRRILRKRRKARLELNGRDLLGQVGTLEIRDMIYDPKTDTVTYGCDLTGEGYNWASDLENLEFCDTELALGSHTADAATIRNSWDRLGVLGTAYDHNYIGCSYFPVHYGWWLYGDYVSILDLRPHAYVRYLLEKAFTRIGYTLTGDYVSSEEFSSICILFTKGVFGPLESEVDKLYKTFDVIPNTYYDGITGPGIPTYLEATPALDGYWYVSTWTQPFTYGMRVVASFNSPNNQFVFGSGVCNFSIYVDDTEVAFICFPVTALDTPFEVVYEGCISKGSKVRVKINPDTCGPIAFTYMEFYAGAQILFSPLGHECFLGDTINLCDTIDPALNFKKIFMGIVHSQGLLVFTDELRKEVELVRVADYYVAAPQEDLTLRVDCSEPLQQDVLTDCINFKVAYLPDAADYALSVDCSEFSSEMFSSMITNDSDDPCVTDLRNPTFAPTNSVGWQCYREKAFSDTPMTQYGTGHATYFQGVASNTHNWAADTWTQPYTCEMFVSFTLVSGLPNDYHRWAIEVDGFPVASAVYDPASLFVLQWFGCVKAGSEIKFAISPDPNISPAPDYIEIDASDGQAGFNYKYARFNDIAGTAAFKPVLPSIVLSPPDLSDAALQPRDVIKYGGEPRIVYYAGLKSDTDLGWTGTFGWEYDDGGGVGTEALFPLAYFLDYYQLNRKSMAFNTITRNTVSPNLAGGVSPATSTGAARVNYGVLLDALSNGVMLKLWIRFTEQEIRNLRFGVPKYFNGISIGTGTFYLNRVKDWNPDKQIALCELIQVSSDLMAGSFIF